VIAAWAGAELIAAGHLARFSNGEEHEGRLLMPRTLEQAHGEHHSMVAIEVDEGSSSRQAFRNEHETLSPTSRRAKVECETRERKASELQRFLHRIGIAFAVSYNLQNPEADDRPAI